MLLLGDGAFGFAGMEFDTLARHGVDVVGVMGNNGIWALEKHPMEFLYGYSVAADLRPETRYDEVVEALGGHGELVARRRSCAPRSSARSARAAGARQRADRPGGRLPAHVEPRLTRAVPGTGEAARGGAGGFKVAPSGRAGVRALRGRMDGPDGGRRRLMRLRPDL